MENIILRNDGLFVQIFNDNLNCLEMVPITERLSYYYNNYVQIEDGLTLGGLFNQLEPYIPLLEDHFMAETRKWPLTPYFDQMKKVKEEEVSLQEIQFSWNCQYFEYTNRRTGKVEKSFDQYVHISARGESDELGVDSYSISFVELNNLKDLPIKILTECQVYGMDGQTILLEYDRDMTWREFLIGLLQEITFYGSPDNTKEVLEDIQERVEEYEYDDSNLVAWKDVELDFLQKELEEAIQEENYEWAERVRLEIEKVKNGDE